MNVSGNTGKSARRKTMVILSLPTLPLRLTFLGIFVFVALTVIVPSYAGFAWLEIILMFAAAGVFAGRESIRRTGSTAVLRRGLGTVVGVIVIGVAVAFVTRFVAAGGTMGAISDHTERVSYVEFDIIVVTLGLLLWVPQLFFGIQLDVQGTGAAQRILLALVAVTASLLTGIYILLEHFGGGSLRGISTGPLVAGVVGLMVLITPVYRSLARACWSRGISGILQFSKYRRDWGKTLTEFEKAVEGARSRPRQEPRAEKISLGWPTWGVFAACACAVFGTFLAVVGNSDGGVAGTGGFLVILAPVIALVCAVGALRRRVKRRRAHQRPAGATGSDRVFPAPGAPLPVPAGGAMAIADVQPRTGRECLLPSAE